MQNASNWSRLWWGFFGQETVFWHDDPRKHMMRRYSVGRDDKTGKLVLSKAKDVTIKMSSHRENHQSADCGRQYTCRIGEPTLCNYV